MRERILEAGRKLFFAHGVLRTSMDDVAAAAATTKRTLYRSFASKELLLEAVLDALVTGGRARFEAVMQAQGPITDRLEAVFGIVVGQGAAVSATLHADVARAFPRLHKRMLAFRQDRLRSLARLLEEGQRSGEVRPDVDPELAVDLLVAGVEHLASGERILRSRHAFPETLRQVFALFCRGVLSDAERAPRAGR